MTPHETHEFVAASWCCTKCHVSRGHPMAAFRCQPVEGEGQAPPAAEIDWFDLMKSAASN